MEPTRKVLLVYRFGNQPMRTTTSEHLFSFQKYCPYPIDYWNIESEPGPTREQAQQYDLVLFHYLFLTHHWGGRATFRDNMRRVAVLREVPGLKVILPQDEFYRPDLFCDFIRDFGIHGVFSVAPEAEWEKIYRGVDFRRVQFFRVLTGYIDEDKQRMIEGLARADRQRDIAIGYRTAGKPYFWFGRHGYLKQQIADAFLERATARGLPVDISTSNRDTITGDDWYRFLMRCKYTIGVESGTSVLDWDGSIHEKTQAYAARHPQAEFAEVEAACFPGMDGGCNLFAVAPRHLESCITRTCQILTKGEYQGVLRPNVHYIEIEKDLSDVDRALDLVASDHLRTEMVERVYRDVVASGKYTYRRFVEEVVEQSFRCCAWYAPPPRTMGVRLHQAAERVEDRVRGLWRRVKRRLAG